MRIRPALAAETELLNALVVRSKAHWGYGEESMAASREALRIAAADVANRRIVVAERAQRVVGVASLHGGPPTAELGLLFVEPTEIGTGVGRALYRHALTTARSLGCTGLRIESDPNAVAFYRAMGARPAGPSRGGLPVLEVSLPAAPAWQEAWTGGRRAVHLGNVAEFQAQFGEVSEQARGESAHYSCLSAFASPHPAVLVLPRPVPPAWIELLTRQLAWDPVEVFDGLDAPCLVAAVLARPALAHHLRNLGLPLVAWGTVPAFAALTGEVLAPTALRCESKRASHALFVRLAPDHPGIAVPEQWPVRNRWAAARAVRARARRGHLTVVKTEHGAGGAGTWVVDGDRIRLPHGPLLLEEHVPGHDLTYDGIIDAAGAVHDVGVAVMDVRGTAYQGATVGPCAVPDPAAGVASRFGHAVGEQVAATGYRGWFDVDLVAGPDGRLSPTEINLRLTGPSTAFMLKARLDAIRGGDHIVRTVDRVPLGARLPDREVDALLRGLSRRCAELDAVLVPTIPTAAYEPAPYLGVALAAHTGGAVDAAEALVRTAARDTRRRLSPPDGAGASRRPQRPPRRSSTSR